MKKIKFTGKLSLNKETVSKLNNEQMNQVVGGSLRCQSIGNCGTTNCETVETFNCTDACPTTKCGVTASISCGSC